MHELSLVPAISELVSESFGGFGVPVYFLDPKGMFSWGRCDTKCISIRDDLSVIVAITTVIFEMCNASHINNAILFKEASSADEYLFEIEVWEHRAVFGSRECYATSLPTQVLSGCS